MMLRKVENSKRAMAVGEAKRRPLQTQVLVRRRSAKTNNPPHLTGGYKNKKTKQEKMVKAIRF